MIRVKHLLIIGELVANPARWRAAYIASTLPRWCRWGSLPRHASWPATRRSSRRSSRRRREPGSL